MKVLVIGGTGTIGVEVVKVLSKENEVISVGYRNGNYQVDIGSVDSINELFKKVGEVDAIVSTTGIAKFGPMSSMPIHDYMLGLTNKLMGQVNLVRLGGKFLNDGGSFTLTSGELSHTPMYGGTSISMVNSGIEGFIRAAALELEGNKRINVVSPKFIKETMESMGMDSSKGMSVSQIGYAYMESINSNRNGEVLEAADFLQS